MHPGIPPWRGFRGPWPPPLQAMATARRWWGGGRPARKGTPECKNTESRVLIPLPPLILWTSSAADNPTFLNWAQDHDACKIKSLVPLDWPFHGTRGFMFMLCTCESTEHTCGNSRHIEITAAPLCLVCWSLRTSATLTSSQLRHTACHLPHQVFSSFHRWDSWASERVASERPCPHILPHPQPQTSAAMKRRDRPVGTPSDPDIAPGSELPTRCLVSWT